MKTLLSFTFVVLCSEVILGQNEAPVITISDGKLRGTSNRTIHANVTYFAYRGIPFAKPPVGDLRFAAPVKNDAWTGILNATMDKDACTQTGDFFVVNSNNLTGSEDCLYINVYTTSVKRNLPVMVFIYGGTFLGGTSAYSLYKPDYFLEKDIIYVAFNYRVGIFGFISTEDLTAPGNWGLKDQLLALKWVKENIKNFGGDPNKVTIFGQSAGAASVAYLTQSMLTSDLFNGAIMQSGSSLCPWALTTNARQKAFQIGLFLGIITFSSKDLIQRLRTIDYKALKYAENNVTIGHLIGDNDFGGLPLGVVVEPEHPDAIVTSKSWELLATGKFQRVPLIIGFVSNETGNIIGSADQLKLLLLKYDLGLNPLAPPGLTRNRLKQLVANGEVKKHFFQNGAIGSNTVKLNRFLNVELYERSIRETVVLASKFSKVYYYEFAYDGYLGDPNNTHIGASHIEDLYYELILGLTPTAADLKTILKMVTLWTNFAKTGSPTPSNKSEVLESLVWEPNDTESHADTTIKVLNINKTLTMRTNPFQQDWDFYQQLYKNFGDPPYATY